MTKTGAAPLDSMGGGVSTEIALIRVFGVRVRLWCFPEESY